MAPDKELSTFIVGRIVKSTAALASLGLLFLVLAGRIDIPGFWIYLAVAIVYQAVSLIIIVPRHPAYVELDGARKARHTNAKAWDRVVLWALAGSTFLMYGLAALDLGRLHLGGLWRWLAIPGIVLYVLGSMLNQWAMVHNPHFERCVRIQQDRGHRVATSGPYRFVRHPGYLGSLLVYLAFPLIVGSALAFAGSLLGAAGTVVRTGLEDRTLCEELVGYAAYAEVVQYRLIPNVW